jgi:hypothetical protein
MSRVLTTAALRSGKDAMSPINRSFVSARNYQWSSLALPVLTIQSWHFLWTRDLVMYRIVIAAPSVTRHYLGTLVLLAFISIILLVGAIGALFQVLTAIASLLNRNIVRARLQTHSLISRQLAHFK